jgi:plastocyanin
MAEVLEGTELMQAFSESLEAVLHDSQNRDAVKLEANALALADLAATPGLPITLARNTELKSVARGHFERLQILAADLAAGVASGDWSDVDSDVEGIRATCVSCHTRFRDPDRGDYPSVHNTISGRVTVTDTDGDIRKDHARVVVFLDRVPAGYTTPSRVDAVVSQRDRSFFPRVLPIVKGTTVRFPNDDTVFHNAFSLFKNDPFDLGTYPVGTSRSRVFAQTGWVRVYCNIHPDMMTSLLVLDNPFFDVTDGAGLFVIPGVPDGDFSLRVWHEFGDEVRQAVSLSDRTTIHLDISVQEHGRRSSHRNKFGRPYREKY